MKIDIITLGCSKNTVDSEHLAADLMAQGHTVVFDQPGRDADCVVINTCGFIGDAKEESIETVLGATAHRKKGQRIVVCGCLVERYRAELQKEIPEVDAWYGVHEWDRMAADLSLGDGKPVAVASRPLSTPGHYAYLKIAEGCNRSCSYCAIPLIRGAHRSRGMDEIVDEARRLVAHGVKELLVISQDTTYYGLDLYRRRALGELLDRLATESGAEWIRLHYTYPSSFPDDAIEAIARHDNICNYIDIPLQHINSRLLASMQRGIDREGTLRLLEKFRRRLPDVAVRTTLIVGYPGETDADFEELKDFVAQARFDRMGCFAYSPEEGTQAYALGDPVPDEEKQRRVDELMRVQEEVSLEKNRARVGRTFRCIVDRKEGDYWICRTEYDSPEVDDEVLVEERADLCVQPGMFLPVCVTDALENDLMGRFV